MSILKDFETARRLIGARKYDAIQHYLDEVSPAEKIEAFNAELLEYEKAGGYAINDWVDKRDELMAKHGVVFLDQVLYSVEKWSRFEDWYQTYYEQEETTMPYYNTKPANEPLSVDKLAAELKQCVELQATMKDVNAYWRSNGTCVGAPGITEAQAIKLDEKIATTRHSWEKQPFSSYDLTNNNSKIKRLQSKVREASRGFAGWEFDGGRAEANTEMNRLQLFFDERPNESQRANLQASGFKWAPSQGAWQRQLTDNAIYSAGRLDFLKPMDGRSVYEHQPKPPARDAGTR